MTARVYGFFNNKGGVTKTTTSVNVGRGLARLGKRTLIIDVDAQSNTTWSIMQKIIKGPKKTIYEAFMKKRPLHELIHPTEDSNLFIVPSSLWMGYAEAKLFNESMREQRLRNALKPYLSKFDYILIDTPPNLGTITINALFACTDVIIPITLNGYSLLGISILLNTIKALRISAIENDINAPMAIFGVIVAQARDNKDAADHLKNVQNYFGDLVFQAKIPLNVDVERANNQGSLFDLYPRSTGAIKYAELVKEMQERETTILQDYDTYLARTKTLLDALPEESEDEEDE